jgi:uncharacterized protein (UPF0147 family)
MKLDKNMIQQRMKELEEIVNKMDVPVYRRRNVSWLKKNLAVKNASNAKFQSAMTLIELLLSNGVAHG